MSRSLSLAAYLALHRGSEPKSYASKVPPRPDGPVIWLRGQSERHGRVARTFAEAFAKDGDPASFLITGGAEFAGAEGAMIRAPNPAETVGAVRAFLRHWRPDLLIWFQGGVDPIVLAETDATRIGRLLVETTGESLISAMGTWVPGMTSKLLDRFDNILATDTRAVARLARFGIGNDRVEAPGLLGEGVPLLPHSEHERQSLARALGPRPIWLAADCTSVEVGFLASAHRIASRRTHRLLLILAPRDPATGPETAARLREMGFETALRSAGEEPGDTTQVYVADASGELGLWYRIAPITYLGGTLIEGTSRHPFEPAALGSAVIHGPLTAGHAEAFARLDAAGAARPIKTDDLLGPAVEALLSPDKAAQLAAAAWSVTSDGSEATQRLVSLAQSALDRREG